MFDLIPWKRKRESVKTLDKPSSFESQFAKIRDDFNSLSERMFDDWSGLHAGLFELTPGWGLNVDDTDKEYIVRAEAPGFEADDFDVELCGRQLVIRAEETKETNSKTESAFSRRSYQRRVNLPQGAQLDNVKATYKNGILELHLPKSENSKTKRIAVKSQ